MSAADELAAGIRAEFRRRVRDEYVPRIGKCVDILSQEELWRRPGPRNNSVGNLLRHLAGNVRQWILAGVANALDERDRDGEFAADAATDGAPGDELMRQLRETVDQATAVVDGLDPQQLLTVKRFQGRWDETVLSAVLHVMEHFSGHAGQIYAYTKQVKDVDLAFYDL